jgi:hypothetical protein
LTKKGYGAILYTSKFIKRGINMKAKNIIFSLLISAAVIALWVLLGISIHNSAIEFLPLSIILAFLVSGIYLSIANKDKTLVNTLSKSLDFVGDFFEKAVEVLVSAIKRTREALDWLWIFGILFTIALSVVYGVFFLYASIFTLAFTILVTIITTLSGCVSLVYHHCIHKAEKTGFVIGAISCLMIIGLFVWHILNMIL